MANTIRAAKNTFGGGLVMDLAPDTTPNEVLTSALNATLVTFNGNELLLQNDMGNGRVETARLPEGYIPVGTCEFGDIIYIVSYNPLTNKSLIGCFPSPERNISSDEIGSTGLMLLSSDFQEMSGSNPTGELKASSIKKIIYNNKLNPGDKFIIYDKNNKIVSLNSNTITDIGNTSHEYGAWPKLLRIHVIAIEDSGKINYLDSTVKWYEDVNYFVLEMGSGIGGGKIDIDQYRNALNSGYSVFQSKISGKLALLIELEKISGFSCTYSIYGGGTTTPENSDITYKDYTIYWNIGWETEDPNINPMCIVLTKSQLVSKSPETDDQAGYRLWETDSEHDGIKLTETYTTIDVPKPFNEEGYWSEYITPYSSELSTLYGATYLDFVTTDSFNTRLYDTLNNIFTSSDGALQGQALTKLNVELGEDTDLRLKNIPIPGSYYVNATQIATDDGGNKTVFTLNTNTGKMVEIHPINIPDIIVNNYFHHSIYKKFETFQVPIELKYTKNDINYKLQPDLSNLIYNYEITPGMPYGLLREYSVEGFIDFGKIGTGAISLNVYKYFVGENAVTLTLGMDAYVEDNKGIDEVCIEFYDNQGLAASYHIEGKDSYSGLFTEVIPLNGVTNTFKLRDTDYTGASKLHLGMEANEDDTNLVRYNESTQEIERTTEFETGKTYINDCGTLYSNMLYLAKIIVKYCPKDALGELDPTQTDNFKVFWRWMYTIPIFNDYYFQVQDFDNIKLSLSLDIASEYSFTDKYYYKVFNYDSENNGTLISDGVELYKYLSAKVQLITNIGNVTADEFINGGGGSGDDSGSGGAGEDPEEDFRLIDVFNSETSFRLIYNKTITSINYDELGLQITTDINNPNATYYNMVRGTDYRVVSGIGLSTFLIDFENIGRTFFIKIMIPSGTILHNNEIPYRQEDGVTVYDVVTQFGYNNGIPVS